MYTRKATIKPNDRNDRDKLTEFVHQLRTSSMYKPILFSTMSKPGFVKKELSMVDTLEGQVFYSSITFATKEDFDNYFADESMQSVWEILEIMANNSDLSFEGEDFEES